MTTAPSTNTEPLVNWDAVIQHLDHLHLGSTEQPIVFCAWAKAQGGRKGWGRHFTKNGRAISTEVERVLSDAPDASFGFIPNPGGTKAGQIQEAVALFTEDDSGRPISLQMKSWEFALLPQPSFSVFIGGKSIHHWWTLQQRITPERFSQLQCRIAQLMAAANPEGDYDTSLSDPCQVMRIAGGIHPGTGQRAEILEATGEQHDIDELEAAIAAAEDEFSLDPFAATSRRKASNNVVPINCEGTHYKDRTAAQKHALVVDALRHCPERGEPGSNTYPVAQRILAALVHEFGVEVTLDLARRADWSQNDHWDIEATAELLAAAPPAAGKRSRIWAVFTIAAEEPRDPHDPWVCPWQELLPTSTTTPAAQEEERSPEGAADDDADEFISAGEQLDLSERLAQGRNVFSINALLPFELADAVHVLHQTLPTDDLSAVIALLTGYSGLLKLGTRVASSINYSVPANLFAAMVMHSGGAKTAVKRVLVDDPAKDIRREAARAHRRSMKEWQAQDKKDRSPTAPRPVCPHLSDYTPAALSIQLQQNETLGLGQLIIRDEMSGLLQAISNDAQQGSGTGEAQLLEAFDGDGYSSIRVESAPRSYDACHVSIFGNIQPICFEN